MKEIWLHFSDITKNELTTIVKVVRVGGVNTRVLLSNGRNDYVPTAYEPAVGDKVILCPYPTNEYWSPSKDATLAGLRKKVKEGNLPDFAIKDLRSRGVKI